MKLHADFRDARTDACIYSWRTATMDSDPRDVNGWIDMHRMHHACSSVAAVHGNTDAACMYGPYQQQAGRTERRRQKASTCL